MICVLHPGMPVAGCPTCVCENCRELMTAPNEEMLFDEINRLRGIIIRAQDILCNSPGNPHEEALTVLDEMEL
jgi:hypothetical protein